MSTKFVADPVMIKYRDDAEIMSPTELLDALIEQSNRVKSLASYVKDPEIKDKFHDAVRKATILRTEAEARLRRDIGPQPSVKEPDLPNTREAYEEFRADMAKRTTDDLLSAYYSIARDFVNGTESRTMSSEQKHVRYHRFAIVQYEVKKRIEK